MENGFFETALARQIEETGCKVLEINDCSLKHKEVDLRFERKGRNLL